MAKFVTLSYWNASNWRIMVLNFFCDYFWFWCCIAEKHSVFSIIVLICILITSLPKVIWEEGRVVALSHMYAVKSPLVTMAHPKFAPKSTPFRGLIPKPHYLPHPWTCLTYDAKQHLDPTRHFCTMDWIDRRTYGLTHRPTDHPRESLITVGRCATRATWPNPHISITSCSKNRVIP